MASSAARLAGDVGLERGPIGRGIVFGQLGQFLEFLLVIAAESLAQVAEEELLLGQLHFVLGAGRLDVVLLAAQRAQQRFLLVDLRLRLGALGQRDVEFARDARLRLALLGVLALGGGDFLLRLGDALLVLDRFAGAQLDQFAQFLQAVRDRLALLLPRLALLRLGGQLDARLGQRVGLRLLLGGELVELRLQFAACCASASCCAASGAGHRFAQTSRGARGRPVPAR